jgi:hypothetical protein
MTSPAKSPGNNLAYVKLVKAKYEVELMQKPNVVGIGIGLVPTATLPPAPAPMQRTLGLIINVSAKPADPKTMPSELDGVPVAVKETKKIRAL